MKKSSSGGTLCLIFVCETVSLGAGNNFRYALLLIKRPLIKLMLFWRPSKSERQDDLGGVGSRYPERDRLLPDRRRINWLQF